MLATAQSRHRIASSAGRSANNPAPHRALQRKRSEGLVSLPIFCEKVFGICGGYQRSPLTNGFANVDVRNIILKQNLRRKSVRRRRTARLVAVGLKKLSRSHSAMGPMMTHNTQGFGLSSNNKMKPAHLKKLGQVH